MDMQNDAGLESGSVLYIGNLDRRVTEAIIVDILDVAKGSNLPQIRDKILSCKMMMPTDGLASDPYCFVTFADDASAKAAMTFFSGREIFGKTVKVNWAAPTAGNKFAGGNFSVFIGDLELSVDDDTLRKAFQPFGQIVNVRVVRDMDSSVSKGYGFVSFRKKNEAEEAIDKMNGQMIGSKSIRTNWATRNKGPPTPAQGDHLNYNDVYQKASLSNCTVYVGGLAEGVTDDLIRQQFSCYGDIADTKLFPDKGYAFIRFHTHNSAATAIVKSHGKELLGCAIKCWWGKEAHDPTSAGGAVSGMMPQHQQQQSPYAMYNPYPYYQQYWAAMQQQQQQQQHAGMMQSNGNQSGHMQAQGYMPTSYNVMPMYQGAGAYGQVPVVQGSNFAGPMGNQQAQQPQQQAPPQQQAGPYANSVYQNTH